MGSVHVVKQGECLSLIARRYGFRDFRTIYDHPDNAAFKKRRPNPNIIRPGDRIVIPDKGEKVVGAATGRVHTFVLRVPRRKLHVVFEDDEGRPFADLPYRLSAPDFEKRGTTASDGSIQTELPMTLTAVKAEVGPLARTLLIGHLDPAWDTEADEPVAEGIQARLANLGYATGAIDGVMGPKTLRAIHAYQRDRGLPMTGPTRELADRLERDHGC